MLKDKNALEFVLIVYFVTICLISHYEATFLCKLVTVIEKLICAVNVSFLIKISNCKSFIC